MFHCIKYFPPPVLQILLLFMGLPALPIGCQGSKSSLRPAHWSLPDCPGSPGKVSDEGERISSSLDFHLLQWGSQYRFLITQSSGSY